MATETPRPTPSIARRLGGVGFRHGSYGEKERRIANAGERYYFVKTEVRARAYSFRVCQLRATCVSDKTQSM